MPIKHPPTVLVLGHARHGKDTVAKILCDSMNWSYMSSSEFCLDEIIFPVLGPRYGYATKQECFDDRGNHREEWKRLISVYNAKDPTRLAQQLLEKHNVYVGMRCVVEFAACVKKQLFDLILWVDASKRVPAVDPSMAIAYDPFMMHKIDNNGTLESLNLQLATTLLSLYTEAILEILTKRRKQLSKRLEKEQDSFNINDFGRAYSIHGRGVGTLHIDKAIQIPGFKRKISDLAKAMQEEETKSKPRGESDENNKS